VGGEKKNKVSGRKKKGKPESLKSRGNWRRKFVEALSAGKGGGKKERKRESWPLVVANYRSGYAAKSTLFI